MAERSSERSMAGVGTDMFMLARARAVRNCAIEHPSAMSCDSLRGEEGGERAGGIGERSTAALGAYARLLYTPKSSTRPHPLNTHIPYTPVSCPQILVYSRDTDGISRHQVLRHLINGGGGGEAAVCGHLGAAGRGAAGPGAGILAVVQLGQRQDEQRRAVVVHGVIHGPTREAVEGTQNGGRAGGVSGEGGFRTARAPCHLEPDA